MHLLATLLTLAQGAPTSQPVPGWAKFLNDNGFLFVLIIPLVFLMVFQARSRRTQDKAQKERLNSIKRGDLVQTIGGVLGKVVEIEESKVRLKVDEGNNSKIWFARNAIHRVVEEEKSETK